LKNDPIVEEIRETRQKLFEFYHNDLNKYLDWLKELEDQDRDRLISQADISNQK
jgi:hypothetical protein